MIYKDTAVCLGDQIDGSQWKPLKLSCQQSPDQYFNPLFRRAGLVLCASVVCLFQVDHRISPKFMRADLWILSTVPSVHWWHTSATTRYAEKGNPYSTVQRTHAHVVMSLRHKSRPPLYKQQVVSGGKKPFSRHESRNRRGRRLAKSPQRLRSRHNHSCIAAPSL